MALKLVRDEPATYEQLIEQLRRAEETAREAEARKKAAQAALMDRLTQEQTKTHDVDDERDPAKTWRAVYVANRRLKVDEALLRKRLGAKRFKEYCAEPKIDMERLNDGISAGSISAEEIDGVVSATEHPSVRLYHVNRKEEGYDDDRPEEAG